MVDDLDNQLDAISKRAQDKQWITPSPAEIVCLTHSFLLTSVPSSRSKAYIALSAVCQRLRNVSQPPSSLQQVDTSTESIHRAFGPSIAAMLADTVEDEGLSGLTFLSALFEVDWQAAASIFQEDGLLESVTDILDIFPASSQIARAVAHLLAQASGHKSCRALISPSQTQWLTSQSRQTKDDNLRASAAVALVKLSRGAGSDAVEVGGSQSQPDAPAEAELVKLMRSLVIDANEASSIADAVEGLAYVSTSPPVKEILSNDSSFLTRLFAIIPRRNGPAAASPEDLGQSPIFGVIAIISNICAYRPRLTQEEAQIAKLRRMAKTPAGSGVSQDPESDPLEDDERVRMRGRKLVKSGVLEALTAAARATESRTVRLAVGKAFLSLVEDKENRGRVLQAGGAKALMLIIQSSSSPQSAKLPQLESADIEPIQALAKLAITASPVQVFGPNEGALYDAIRPFSLMLVHSSSNLLQRFEALMALTNLSSSTPEVASRIARAEGLMNKVELLMLEEHTLVRRAATELVCNLVAGCEDVYNKYGGERSSASKSKLQVLVALSLPHMRVGPVGLQHERHRVLPIFGQLVDPSIVVPGSGAENEDEDEDSYGQSDPGLVHRGVVCLRNIFLTGQDAAARNELATEADRIGVVRALVGVVKGSPGDAPVLRPTAEALKWVLESGIEITV
ncbi:ARM repeat-containing protein [Amylocystis lapponica]|nr:ARM repeat-containing protein [Amylocystis lapponica]